MQEYLCLFACKQVSIGISNGLSANKLGNVFVTYSISISVVFDYVKFQVSNNHHLRMFVDHFIRPLGEALLELGIL